MAKIQLKDLAGVFDALDNAETIEAVKVIMKILKDGKIKSEEIGPLIQACFVVLIATFGLVGLIQDLTKKE